MNYQVADYIIRVKNAALAGRKNVVAPYAKLSNAIAQVLLKEKFLADVKKEEREGKPVLISTIRYEKRESAVQGVAMISKPSLRVYVKSTMALQGAVARTGTKILSTNKGIMTGKQARKEGIGGELLFTIW